VEQFQGAKDVCFEYISGQGQNPALIVLFLPIRSTAGHNKARQQFKLAT